MVHEQAPLSSFESGSYAARLRRTPEKTPALRRSILTIAAAAAMTFFAGAPARPQEAECLLIADDRNPPERILRCGANLSVRTAAGTNYHAMDRNGDQRPKALQLDEGALMLEFNPSRGRRTFQILTPHAIAAVRGTKWIVEVTADRTSAFVISGRVSVRRILGAPNVFLGPGEGADVTLAPGPIVVKRWAEKRVNALLARFGE